MLSGSKFSTHPFNNGAEVGDGSVTEKLDITKDAEVCIEIDLAIKVDTTTDAEVDSGFVLVVGLTDVSVYITEVCI